MIALQGDRSLPAPDYLQLITPDLQDMPLPDLSTVEGQEVIDQLSVGVDLIIIDNLSTLARKGFENEAESWLPIQTWALKKRREGKSILFVHHANKNGGQRGTSRREDVLDAVINLKQPSDHTPDEGARFQVVFEKTRHFANEEADSFEVFLHTEDGVWHWGIAESEQDELMPRILSLHQEGKSIREIAKILEITKGKVEARLKKHKDVHCPAVQNPIENGHKTLEEEHDGK